MINDVLRSAFPSTFSETEKLDLVRKHRIHKKCASLSGLLDLYNNRQLREHFEKNEVTGDDDLALELAQDLCGGIWDEDLAYAMTTMVGMNERVRLSDLQDVLSIITEIEKKRLTIDKV